MKKCPVNDSPESHSVLKDVVLLGPHLMAATLEHAGRFVRLTSNMLVGRFPHHHHHEHHHDEHHHHEHDEHHHHSAEHSCCCEIPETHCPPRCVCEIKWQGRAGEQLKSSIRVTNTSKKPRSFHFTANSFQGPGNPQTPLTLSQANANLGPGQSTFINVSFTPNQVFQPGQTYHAEVLIKGAYEQCVCFEFTALREGHVDCEVEQGDPPIRVKAHQWYDHFQCAEPCFPVEDPRVAVDQTHVVVSEQVQGDKT
jgi:hypothetical protein